MKVQVMSDLHTRYPGARGFPPLSKDVDIVMIAGDVCEGLPQAIREARAAYPTADVVQIAGNHEFYGGATYASTLAEGRQCAQELCVHLLENQTVFFGELRIIGATLWTDYGLLGEAARLHAMRVARDTMRDHKQIKWRKNPWRRFRPAEARSLHLTSRDFIDAELGKPHDGPTIVLTHHAALPEAVEPSSRDRLISAAYASDLKGIIDRHQPEYWVSGHTHFSLDMRRGRTRLISNPCGYGAENESCFDPAMIIEVDA